MPNAAPFYRQKLLYGFCSVSELIEHVRAHGAEGEVDRLPEIVGAWKAIASDVDAVVASEAGLSEAIRFEELPPAQASIAAALVDDKFLQQGLSPGHSVAIVEIDKLVAAQRRVNLDFVEQIAAGLPDEITLDFLVDFCLSPRRDVAPIQHLELGRDAYVFSSISVDLRFLGSFVRPISEGDLAWVESGGIPMMAVVSVLGYGDRPVNILWSGSRAVLNNGFHRVYALRERGVRHIPVIVQPANDRLSGFPSHVVDLPRDYLLSHPRPALMKDFFEDKFNTVLKIKNRLKAVSFRPDVQQNEVPC